MGMPNDTDNDTDSYASNSFIILWCSQQSVYG